MKKHLFNLLIFNNIVIKRNIFNQITLIHKQFSLKRFKWYSLLDNENQLLLQYNYFQLFKEYLTVQLNSKKNNDLVLGSIIKTCIKLGRIKYLEYLLDEKNIELNHYVHASTLLNLTAQYNQFEILMLLDRIEITNDPYDYDEALIYAAESKSNNLAMVQWLSDRFGKYKSKHVPAIVSAASRGNLEILEWLLVNRLEESRLRISSAVSEAFLNSQLDVVKLLYERGYITQVYMVDIDLLCIQRDLQCIIWSHQHCQTQCTTVAMDSAASRGYFDIVKWLHENRTEGCTTQAMDNAAARGYFDIVKWLHENRTEGCTTHAIDYAVMHDRQSDMVKWLHENRTEGCTNIAMYNSSISGNLDVFKFLEKNRTEGFPLNTIVDTCSRGQLKMLEYLYQHYREQSYYWLLNEMILVAAKKGYLEIIRFLHLNYLGFELHLPFNQRVITEAILLDNIEIVQYLIENNIVERDYSSLIKYAQQKNKKEIVVFLLNYSLANS